MNRLFPNCVMALALVSAGGSQLVAQTETAWSHRIGLRSGYLYAANRDELASPLKYSGGTLPVALSYDYAGASHRHQVRILFRSGLFESAVTNRSDHQQQEIAGSLQYALLFQSYVSEDERLLVFAGGAWSNTVATREYTYNAMYDGDELFGELYSSLSAACHAEYRVSERSWWTLELSLPVLTFAVRPGYTSPSPAPEEQDEFRAILKGGKFSSWESFRAFDLGVGYDYALGALVDISFEYRLQYFYYDKPQPTATSLQYFNIGFLFKL